MSISRDPCISRVMLARKRCSVYIYMIRQVVDSLDSDPGWSLLVLTRNLERIPGGIDDILICRAEHQRYTAGRIRLTLT